ncbi:MAG: chemotaxis protein methyltransferase CheR [Oceanospirillaceae bacterium]
MKVVNQLTEETPKREPNAREFQMSKQNFTVISEVIYKYSGIVLKDIKEDMVYNRVSRRVRKTGCRGFDDYLAMALQQESDEFTHFVNAITTNFTSFFRESHHFDFIKNTAIPEWKSNPHRKKLRIWSAGSSTGEEAYSIAMTLNDQIPNVWDTKILATDLDTNVVAQGESGIYSPDRVGDLSSMLVSQYFDKIGSGEKERVQVKKSLRNMTFFKPLNLLQDWPMSGQFEMIFCRNVVIYFDKPIQKLLFNRFADLLSPGGYLIIGHAESMYNLSDRFTSIGNTVYRKTK